MHILWYKCAKTSFGIAQTTLFKFIVYSCSSVRIDRVLYGKFPGLWKLVAKLNLTGKNSLFDIINYLKINWYISLIVHNPSLFSEGKSNVLFKAHFFMVRRGINLLDNNIHMMRTCVLVHYNNITVNNKVSKKSLIGVW